MNPARCSRRPDSHSFDCLQPIHSAEKVLQPTPLCQRAGAGYAQPRLKLKWPECSWRAASGLFSASNPNPVRSGEIVLKPLNQSGGIVLDQDAGAMQRLSELLDDRLVEELQQGVEISAHVEHPAGLLMNSEQAPTHDFGKFLKSAETAG